MKQRSPLHHMVFRAKFLIITLIIVLIISVVDLSLGLAAVSPPKNLRFYKIESNLILNPSAGNELEGWLAEPGITLAQAQNNGVKLSGTQDGSWNYAQIGLADKSLEPGMKYRLEAELKVDSISDISRPPYLCIYVLNSSGKKLSDHVTFRYQTAELNTWQKLFVEFKAEQGAQNGYIKIKKGYTGTNTPLIYIRNISVQQIEDFGLEDRLKFDSVPAGLLAMRNKRPRLFLDDNRIQYIKSRLGTYPYSKFWTSIKGRADKYITESPPIDASNYTDSSIRNFGNKLPYMALAYLFTKDNKYLRGVKTWMNALCSYPNWASDTDLGAAHILEGMALAYDWLYNQFTADERKKYREKITHHAEIFYWGLINKNLWWANYYLDNHNYVNTTALSSAGLALYGEQGEAESWIIVARNNFQEVLSALSPDGASHEGVAYWSYGTRALLKYFMVFEPVFGLTDVKNNSFFKNTARFRLYASLPDFKDNVDFGDSCRWDFSGPGNTLHALASIFRDGHAQWLAEQIENARGASAKFLWSEIILYDSSVAMLPPDALPKTAYFDNIGIVISRSDWSSDAIWTFFKAGPHMGHLAEDKGYYLDNGHMHPDEGNFLLWAFGKWLIVDDGYVNIKRTRNHNVLLFNDKGQIGEGKDFFDTTAALEYKPTASINYHDIQSNYIYLVAEIEDMYPPDAGVRKWERHFIFFQKGFVVIRDIVKMDNLGKIESLVHFDKGTVEETGGRYFYKKSGIWASINDISSDTFTKTWSDYEIAPAEQSKDGGSNNYGTLLNVSKSNVGACTNTLVIGVARDKASLTKVQIEELDNATKLSIKTSDFQAQINFSAKTAIVK